MRWVKLFAAMSAAIWGTASAQSNFLGNQSQEIIPSFDAPNLVSAIVSLGGTPEILTLQNGYRAVGVETPSGARFVMYPTVCDEQQRGCKGVSIQTGFNFEGLTPQNVNAFNDQGNVPKLVLSSDGVARMYHYMIADTGILRSNFNAHIAVMDGSIRRYLQFWSTVTPRADSVSVDGGPVAGTLLVDGKEVHLDRSGKPTKEEAAYLYATN